MLSPPQGDTCTDSPSRAFITKAKYSYTVSRDGTAYKVVTCGYAAFNYDIYTSTNYVNTRIADNVPAGECPDDYVVGSCKAVWTTWNGNDSSLADTPIRITPSCGNNTEWEKLHGALTKPVVSVQGCDSSGNPTTPWSNWIDYVKYSSGGIV